jgi:Na+/proline symporter
MRALVLQGAQPELGVADQAAPQFLQNFAHPLLAGVVFAGLFAAIMSTADGFLNIGAAAIVHDIPKALTGRSLNRELFWARTMTLIIAIGAAFFVLYARTLENLDLVALLGAFGWGTFAAALVPVVAIGFNWKRATPLAANVAIVSSLIINFAPQIFRIPIPYGINIGAISLLISLTLFFGISLASKPPILDDDIAAIMEL